MKAKELAQKLGIQIIPQKSPWGWPSFSGEARELAWRDTRRGAEANMGNYTIRVEFNRRFKSWDVTMHWPGGKWLGCAVKGSLDDAKQVAAYLI